MVTVKDKVAIITGAARGIGRATTETFLKDGAKVVMVDVNEGNLSKATSEIAQFSAQILTQTADTSRSKDVQRVVDETIKKFGRVDILVNNAGIVRDSTLLKMTEDQFDAVISVNLRGVFLFGQACARIMAEQKYGKIVNVSSAAWRGNFGQTNYSAAKAGVIGMTKTWALELSKYNVNVNAVAPGFISTDMTATIPPEFREKMVAQIPLKRAGEAQDVANLIRFLASDAASYIQGEVVAINGGFQM